ncbi:MAG: hypothetical protein IH851_09555, partial [Armatimonadetes bacterium]|nr:hypothetical protein [Armatimonadota bacterium]
RCLLIPCDFDQTGDANDPAAVLSGGAPEIVRRLEAPELHDFASEFTAWIDALPSRPRAEALKASEEFQDFFERYLETLPDERAKLRRAAHAEFLSLFANALAGGLRRGRMEVVSMLGRAVEMHGAVQGNVNFGYLADSLFSETLPA